MAARAVRLFSLSVNAVGVDITGLHEILLRSPAIRDVASPIPFVYLIKSDRTGRELARLVRPFVPSFFVVAALRATGSAGFLPQYVADWMDAEPSPPRGEAHEPAPFDIALLPTLDCLLPTESERQMHSLILSEPMGAA